MTSSAPIQQQKKQSFISNVIFLTSIVVVRLLWYEWRPWHSLSLKRECVVWSLTIWLYSRVNRKATRPPLQQYGRYALVQQEYLQIYQRAFEKRGLDIAVLVNDDNGARCSDNKSNDTTTSTTTTVTRKELATWLGTQQWNGGVGVCVVSSTKSMTDAHSAVQQHYEFRSSGAVITMMDDDETNYTAENMKEENNGIVNITIPLYLQSSPSMAEASIQALGYSRRLKLHQVLKQHIKDSITNMLLLLFTSFAGSN